MKMLPSRAKSLRDKLGSASNCLGRYLWGADVSVSVADVLTGTSLNGYRSRLSGRSVLLATHDQIATGLALIELDGVARRLTICPSDLPYEQFPSVIIAAEVDAIISDNDELKRRGLDVELHITPNIPLEPTAH